MSPDPTGFPGAGPWPRLFTHLHFCLNGCSVVRMYCSKQWMQGAFSWSVYVCLRAHMTYHHDWSWREASFYLTVPWRCVSTAQYHGITCVCLCVACAWACVCPHTCMYLSMCVYLCAYLRMCVYVPACTCVCIPECVCLCICVLVCLCTCVCTYLCRVMESSWGHGRVSGSWWGLGLMGDLWVYSSSSGRRKALGLWTKGPCCCVCKEF